MVYEFRSGTRAPKNVTAAMVMEDRARLAKSYGQVTTSLATTAVERNPKTFPGLAGFITWDVKEAVRKCHEREVSYAFAAVTIRELTPAQQAPIRALVTLHEKGGDIVWEPVQVVLQNFDSRARLFAEIEQELRDVTEKLAEFRKLDVALRQPAERVAAGKAG